MIGKKGDIQRSGSSNKDLQTAMDGCPVGIVVFNEEERVIYANPRAEQLFQKKLIKPGEIKCGDFISCKNRNTDPHGCGHTPACPNCPILQAMRSTLSSEAAFREGETYLSRDPGYEPMWVGYKFSSIGLNSSRVAVMAFDEITPRKEAEARDAHIKQVLLAIRNINQLMVQETDPHRLIERACANLTETMGYYNAWIALMDEAGTAVTMTASTGFDGGFQVMRERLERSEFTACMKRTLAQDELVVIKDPPSECPDCPLAGEYAGRAGLTRRLAYDGNIYGILSVSVPADYAHDAEAQDLFREVTND